MSFLACNVNYTTLNFPDNSLTSSTFITGISAVTNSDDLLISGMSIDMTNYIASGLIYQGDLQGDGTWTIFNHPNAASTLLYKTIQLDDNSIQSVGSYKNNALTGFIYQGPPDGSGAFTDIVPYPLETTLVLVPVEVQRAVNINDRIVIEKETVYREVARLTAQIKGTIVHDVMNGYAVGNYFINTNDQGSIVPQLKAFIYDIANDTYHSIEYPNSFDTTAYGIWYNGNTSYTIVGGYDLVDTAQHTVAYMVDWDSSQPNAPYNFKSFHHNNNKATSISHFEGITSDGNGGYNLASDYSYVPKFTNFTGLALEAYVFSQLSDGDIESAIVNVGRTPTGGFGTAQWLNYDTPNALTESSSAIYANTVVGMYFTADNNITANGYTATFADCLNGDNYCYGAPG